MLNVEWAAQEFNPYTYLQPWRLNISIQISGPSDKI